MNIETLKPLFNRVLVKRLPNEEDTIGSIIVPDSAKKRSDQGIVLAVGPGRRLKNGKIYPMGIKKGDRVAFGRYSGADLPDRLRENGYEYLIMRDDEIFGVIEK